MKMNLVCATAVAVLGLALLSAQAATQYDSGDPTAAEQLVLEMINRARSNPTAEGTRLGIDITEGLPDPSLVKVQPPLAMNKILLQTARDHSSDMYNRSYFAHNTPEGVDPFQRMTNAGYNWTFAGENIATSSSATAAQLEDNLMIDAGVAGRGHRVNLLDIHTGDPFREVGPGYFSGATRNSQGFKDFLTEDFGSSSTGPFVLGVVYDDKNGNNFYDIGEGISAVTITPDSGANFAVTATAGGYAFPVGTSGSLTLTASGGTLNGTITKTITLNGSNIKVDFKASEASGGGGSTPAITSSLTASGTVGQAFSYQITATNTPTTFGASPLPAGLSISGSTISGTPTTAGQTNVTITAGNSAGSDSKTLVITIAGSGGGGGSPPAITSSLSASGTVGDTFSYQITATNTPTTFGASPLPAGLSISGSTISGTPTTAGQTNVTITAGNSAGSDSKTLVITINSTFVSNSTIDSDGDGFPNEIETALGTDPNNANSTPFGGSPAGTPQPLTISKLSIKLNFIKGASDGIQLSGLLPVPQGFVIANQQVMVDVGGVVKSFALSSKGASLPGLSTFKLKVKNSKSGVAAQSAPFTAKFSKGDFVSLLSDEGLTKTRPSGSQVSVPVIILFNQQLFQTTVVKLYSVNGGKTGMTK
ncbi:MAG TPA: CAP domain-containing protein [Planctomycetota bacterium]|jgi:hypothetical protein